MNAKRMLFAFLCLFRLAGSDWALASQRGDHAAIPTMENEHLRVELHQNPSHANWRLVLFVAGPDAWRVAANLSVGGNLASAGYAAEYRRRLGTYYPLQKAMPENVRLRAVDGVQEMTFRLAVEDLWLDLRLILPADLPFLWVTAPAVSHPFLVPETSIRFDAPCQFVVADDPTTELRRARWQARDFRERGLWTRNTQYLAAALSDPPLTAMVFWLPDTPPKRTQWGRTLRNVLPHAPYAIGFDPLPFDRDPHSVQHRTVGS